MSDRGRRKAADPLLTQQAGLTNATLLAQECTMAMSMYLRRTCADKTPNVALGGNPDSDPVTTFLARAGIRGGAVGARRS